MRVLHPTLELAQKQPSVKPAVMITVGDIAFRTGSTTTCHNVNGTSPLWVKDEGGRILYVKELESPYKQTAEIVLNNYDRLLFDLSLKGERIYISWGASTTEGDLYSTSPVMWVESQTFYEAQGVMQCRLKCIGIMDLLNKDLCVLKYTDSGTYPIGSLIGLLCNTPGDLGFTNCKVYDIVCDDALDDLWTGVYLGESFVIERGETRAHVLARLLDMTHASMRPGNEPVDANGYDTVHVFTPPMDVQSKYTLERDNHRFYVDSDSSSIVFPNEIVIKTPAGYTPAYSGTAREPKSYSTNPCSKTQLVAGLVSSNQAQTIANTMLANIINAQSGSSALVPMNCGTEIFDRMEIYSKRSGRTMVGSVGAITRIFDPRASVPRYDMSVGYGKWFDPRAKDDSLGYGYGFIDDTTPSSNTYDSGHATILAADYSSKSSGFTEAAFAMYATVDAEWVKYKFQSGAGTYKVIVSGYGSAPTCTVDTYIDDVLVDSTDFTTYFNAKITATLTEGEHVIKVLINDIAVTGLELFFIGVVKSSFMA